MNHSSESFLLYNLVISIMKHVQHEPGPSGSKSKWPCNIGKLFTLTVVLDNFEDFSDLDTDTYAAYPDGDWESVSDDKSNIDDSTSD